MNNVTGQAVPPFRLPEFSQLQARIAASTPADVERALRRPRRSDTDLAALLSAAAEPRLAEMADLAGRLTRQRFGRVIQLYAPLYLSSFCANRCLYCGFSVENRIERRVLALEEAEKEALILARRGFSHILLVAGEAPARLGVDYLAELATRLRHRFASIAIEVQPLTRDEYARLFAAGITGVAVYQETYDRRTYDQVHIAGLKADYDRRLEIPARVALAGMREVGLGALLGLADWRAEGLALGLHLAYLRKLAWRTAVTISFPRLRPAAGGFAPLVPVSEKNLSQLLFALRLFDEDVGLVLSTREEVRFRDGMIGLAPTRYSAGSCTIPGGYGDTGATGEQFSIGDSRSIEEVAAAIRAKGFDPVRKDWDAVFQQAGSQQ
ncbi:2-iminoacetate synthase ThiH [Desulfurivibrio alkaliphilus]|uniref:Thiazole biosynthesis protein ThiH n=1 Tax=Desulfurivibrio alkaliphilus (strain DSM 19089 / UNIQEM U267 / AHT2) TaxID=589865 RepID=D6Z3J1_DESAT|nr:2-iminoacetate synthase ThiH [Desulfurivibrio alkaliphilus]ADH86116.1 thiazole biosynthesis protein ThiH [Desulfurivibrio alkaliphilus AHT 2]